MRQKLQLLLQFFFLLEVCDFGISSDVGVGVCDGRECGGVFGVVAVELFGRAVEELVVVQKAEITFVGVTGTLEDGFSVGTGDAQDEFGEAVVDEEVSWGSVSIVIT